MEEQYVFDIKPVGAKPIDRSQLSALGYQLARQYHEIKNALADVRRELTEIRSEVEDMRDDLKGFK